MYPICPFRSYVFKCMWKGRYACHTFAFVVMVFPMSTLRNTRGKHKYSHKTCFGELGQGPSWSGSVKVPPALGPEWNLSVIIIIIWMRLITYWEPNTALSGGKRIWVRLCGWCWPTTLQISLCEGSAFSCCCGVTSQASQASSCEEVEVQCAFGGTFVDYCSLGPPFFSFRVLPELLFSELRLFSDTSVSSIQESIVLWFCYSWLTVS